MRKTIVFGVFLSIFLMLVVPNVNAIQYVQMNEAKNQRFQHHLDTLGFDEETIDKKQKQGIITSFKTIMKQSLLCAADQYEEDADMFSFLNEAGEQHDNQTHFVLRIVRVIIAVLFLLPTILLAIPGGLGLILVGLYMAYLYPILYDEIEQKIWGTFDEIVDYIFPNLTNQTRGHPVLSFLVFILKAICAFVLSIPFTFFYGILFVFIHLIPLQILFFSLMLINPFVICIEVIYSLGEKPLFYELGELLRDYLADNGLIEDKKTIWQV